MLRTKSYDLAKMSTESVKDKAWYDYDAQSALLHQEIALRVT